ncbi:MAG: methionyl-tRNA formyltransferase [Bacteroidales bacterium]|nr:methionyl-tRNA formyltransferase [Bacteroidales bacterium]
MNKKDLKIVFFGTPEFAVESLRAIVENGYNVVGVVTMPDKIAGRGHHLIQSAVKQFAVEHDLPVLQPERLKDEEFVETLKSLNADLFVVIAFRMLPEVVWTMPPLGTFNLHASLLPRYRGAAPINRAVMNGDTKTGVTTFFLQHEIDTGDIIDRVAIDILPEDNVGDVHDKLMELGAKLTVKTIDSIVDGTLTTTPQSVLVGEGEVATPAPKIFKETCRIDWTRPAVEIHNHVRGLSPYPAAWTVISSETTAPVDLKIFKTTLTDKRTDQKAGSVVVEKDRMFVACGDGLMIELNEVQPAGKRRIEVDAYLRGARLFNPVMN